MNEEQWTNYKYLSNKNDRKIFAIPDLQSWVEDRIYSVFLRTENE